MEHSCPLCGASLAKRKLTQAIITRMDMDCPHCLKKLKLNVHPAEMAVVLLFFTAFLLLVVLSYSMQSQPLALAAFIAAMLGAGAPTLLERTYLRRWPRYIPIQG